MLLHNTLASVLVSEFVILIWTNHSSSGKLTVSIELVLSEIFPITSPALSGL